MNRREQIAFFRRKDDAIMQTRLDLLRWLQQSVHSLIVVACRAGQADNEQLSKRAFALCDELTAAMDDVKILDRIVDVQTHPTFGYVTHLVRADGSRDEVRQ